MKNSSIIILNGPSCSGKSSIQKEFQQLMMPELWLKMGVDLLFDAVLPDITPQNSAYWLKENHIRWIENSYDKYGHSIITLNIGNEAQRVVHAMNRSIATYAAQGCDIIVDYIAYKHHWLEDLINQLQQCDIYLIKVSIDLVTLEKREKNRATSPVGHARSHYEEVYGNWNYDLVIDTTHLSAQHSAIELKRLIKKA